MPQFWVSCTLHRPRAPPCGVCDVTSYAPGIMHYNDYLSVGMKISSVEEQVLEGGEKTDETGGVSGCGTDDRGAVSTLEVGLDHLIILAVTQRHRT